MIAVAKKIDFPGARPTDAASRRAGGNIGGCEGVFACLRQRERGALGSGRHDLGRQGGIDSPAFSGYLRLVEGNRFGEPAMPHLPLDHGVVRRKPCGKGGPSGKAIAGDRRLAAKARQL